MRKLEREEGGEKGASSTDAGERERENRIRDALKIHNNLIFITYLKLFIPEQ